MRPPKAQPRQQKNENYSRSLGITAPYDDAVWLFPSPEFRQHTLARRGGWRAGFFAETSNPERVLHNMPERDRMFTDRLMKKVEDLELRAIDVNTSMAEDDSANSVMQIFGL